MDPLSVASGVIAVLQATNSVLTLCYNIRENIRKTPWSFIQIIEETRDLRNIIEAIQLAIDEPTLSIENATQYRAAQNLSESITGPLAACLQELLAIESKIQPGTIEGCLESKRKTLIHAVGWMLKDGEAKESITRLERCKNSLSLAINSHSSVTVRNIQRMTISLSSKVEDSCTRLKSLAKDFSEARLNDQQRDMVDWLSPLKPWEGHEAACRSHEAGTSKWFINSVEYVEWVEAKNNLLWLSGPPGMGKTTLMSQAVDSLATNIDQDNLDDALYAFVYCDFRNPDSRSSIHVLGSLLAQICSRSNCFPDELLSAFRTSTDRNQCHPPTTDTIIRNLNFLASKRRIYLFVDAIDESHEPEILSGALADLAISSAAINIMATSRNHTFDEKKFEKATRVLLENRVVEMEIDVQHYIDKRLSTDPGLVWFSKELRQLVSSSINSKSNGMFRWAHCQVDSLTQARTPKFVKRSLASLPSGLDETYGRALAAVSPYDVPLVQKSLTWLAFSIVPITLDQLWEALAIEPGLPCIDEESRLRSPQDILSLSNNLISLTPDGQVALSHLSVRDYLLSESIHKRAETSKFALSIAESHHMLALDCLTYILFTDLSQGPATTQQEYLSRIEQLPLLTYATKCVFYHLQNTGPDHGLRELALQFLSHQARPNFMSWVQVLNADAPFKWNVYPKHATPLYYAASFGLRDLVQELLDSGGAEDLDVAGSRFGGSAMHAAAIRNHTAVMKLLVEAGANPGKADFNKVTPLHSAAGRGLASVVQLLLRHGAPTDVKDAMDGKTPAEWARLSGHEEVAQMIDRGLNGVDLKELGFQDSGNSASKPESGEVNVWQPGKPECRVMSDFYEGRSGLDSSTVLGFEIEGQKVTLGTVFSPSGLLEPS